MFYRVFYSACVGIILISSGTIGVLFYASEQPWVDFSVLENYNPGKPSVLLDDEGNEWARFALDKRDIVPFNRIPASVIQAFLAAEDWKFFSHNGLSYKGIIRSLIINTVRRKRAQGASTITQQLVRLLFFEPRKSYIRKIKEQVLSLVVEQQFTKGQILHTYLNHIYLGAGIYGVEAACQRFWGISVKDCSIDQAASLAAIVQYPRNYCPLYNPQSNMKRRNHVLSNMRKLSFITQEEYEKACATPVTILAKETNLFAAHLKETIRQFLEETFGKKQLYTGGLRIQTTLNSAMQKAAEDVFEKHFIQLHKQIGNELEGALVSIEGSTGALKALVGGTDFKSSQFNRAFQAKRQMASTFKALVYAQALQKGKTFIDLEVDEPITLQQGNTQWSPTNAFKTFKGTMTLAHALSHSNNIVTYKTYVTAGPDEVVRLAQSCGLEPTHAYPSLSLGCIDVTPLQAAAMMNVFAQEGRFVTPYFITWVKDEWGTKLYKAHPEKKKVLSPSIARQVGHILSLRIEQARKQAPRLWCTCDALGKSGTTNDARSCWFVGATPNYTTSVYIGFDDNRSPGKWIFATRTAFPIWRAFNKEIKQPKNSFNNDPTLEEVTVHSLSGEPCQKNEKNSVTVLIPRAA